MFRDVSPNKDRSFVNSTFLSQPAAVREDTISRK